MLSVVYFGFHKQRRLHTRCTSRSALIEETKEDVSMTDEDISNEPVVDIGQVDPVSILIYTLQATVDHKQHHWLLVTNIADRVSMICIKEFPLFCSQILL